MRATAVRFLDQVADRLGLERPVFVANSMGGLWATWLALDLPDRVAALVYVGAPALLPGTSAPLLLRLLSVPVLGPAITASLPVDKRMDRLSEMVHQDLSAAPEVRAVLVGSNRMPGVTESFLAHVRSLLTLRDARPELALTLDDLAAVRQPARFVWAKDDPFGDVEKARRAVAAMPNADLRVVPGGHLPWVNEPDAVGPPVREALENQLAPQLRRTG